MKKIIITLVLSIQFLCPISAQDTLYLNDIDQIKNILKPDYWPTRFHLDPNKKKKANPDLCSCWNRGQSSEEGWRVYTEDTLLVYGIATSMSAEVLIDTSIVSILNSYGFNTSLDSSYNFLRLYEASPDSLIYLGDEMKVHPTITPVAYYFQLSDYVTFGGLPWPILPMYERFFPSPKTVVDSFYIGYRYGPQRDEWTQIGVHAFGTGILPHDTVYHAHYADYIAQLPFGQTDTIHGWQYMNQMQFFPLLFPILASPDTTTNGIEKPDMVYRYTSVQPNPATEKVQIISSFGLQNIEVYNTTGTCVYKRKVTGLSTIFDVSTWPKGMYVMHITTSAGSTSKKVIIK